ncbi:uncharacterized protein [Apostichopus japonicus]|uniref:uncharacterized protein n=1 Tax=Stichopus japonicus TaxID=307972 RepID=UPI003AB783F2
MDTRVGTCCNGEVVNGIGECCGDGVAQIYQPGNDLCCSSNGASVVFESSRNQKCCGMDKYDPQLELCCDMVVNERISDLTSCCGNTAYEDDSGMCCGDQVVPRGFSTDCCGQTAYNEDNEVCCHGEVIQASGQASCCYDEPYNPDASTCVNGGHSYFHVEVEVPLIDGITRVFWGNDTAYLVTQAFECGGSLHYYGANTDNACCADVLPYNTELALCCKDYNGYNLVHKDKPMDKCCGRTSYTPEVEGCCNGNEKFSLSEQKCCPDGTIVDKSVDCNGVPPCFLANSMDKMCKVELSARLPERHISYNSATSECTAYGLRAKLPGLQSCGDRLFKTSENICCGGRLRKRFFGNLEAGCCGSINPEIYLLETMSCVHGMVYEIPEAHVELCAGRPYDSRYHGCDEVFNIRMKDEILALPDSCYNSQNGQVFYNSLIHACCAGELITADHTCCNEFNECCQSEGLEGYNFKTHMCCGGRLVEKEAGYACCGTQTYDTRDEAILCCGDELTERNENGGLRCDNGAISGRVSESLIICGGIEYHGSNIECCGNDKYDPSSEICCRDRKYQRTDDHQECCGSVPFSPEEGALCCEDSLYYETSDGDACCDKLKYNTFFQTCCTTGGKNYVMSVDDQCCSNGEAVDTSRDTCCDGLIHKEIVNGQCCGNQVIRDPVQEQCCGGNYYHISSGPKQCCNDQLIATFATCEAEE